MKHLRKMLIDAEWLRGMFTAGRFQPPIQIVQGLPADAVMVNCVWKSTAVELHFLTSESGPEYIAACAESGYGTNIEN